MGKRRYAIVGLGAIGGLYGAQLVAAGHEVHFLARSDADHVRDNGLLLESPWGDKHLTGVSVARTATEIPEVDVVVLAVKTTDTAAALPIVATLAGDSADVLVLQNGLGVEALVAEAVPGHTVLGGMCFTCSLKAGPGHVRHIDYGRVTIGEFRADGSPAGTTAIVQAVADDFAAAGVPVEAIDDLETGRWRKLVWNIPYNGLSVVLDVGADVLMADPVTRSLVVALMEEVVAGAAACGHVIDPSFVQTMLDTTDRMEPYATSMKLDYDAGRPLELDRIYAAPITTARDAGFEMTRADMLWSQLRFLDARRR